MFVLLPHLNLVLCFHWYFTAAATASVPGRVWTMSHYQAISRWERTPCQPSSPRHPFLCALIKPPLPPCPTQKAGRAAPSATPPVAVPATRTVRPHQQQQHQQAAPLRNKRAQQHPQQQTLLTRAVPLLVVLVVVASLHRQSCSASPQTAVCLHPTGCVCGSSARSGPQVVCAPSWSGCLCSSRTARCQPA